MGCRLCVEERLLHLSGDYKVGGVGWGTFFFVVVVVVEVS